MSNWEDEEPKAGDLDIPGLEPRRSDFDAPPPECCPMCGRKGRLVRLRDGRDKWLCVAEHADDSGARWECGTIVQLLARPRRR